MNRLFKQSGIFRSRSHHLPTASIHRSVPGKIHPIMANHRSSSSCPHSPVPHSQLVELQTQGFLPPAYIVLVRAGLATYNGGEQAESFPNPSTGERVCLIPYLLRGLGFPIHPFLRGLLEFYGLQLHNFTPASILHIGGYVALCELFMGCEAHFELWQRLFCLVPRT